MKRILTLTILCLTCACNSVLAQSDNIRVYDVMPSFQGGDINTFARWVTANVKWPQKAIENRISGKVTTSFAVDIDGRISDIKIIQTPDKILSDEVVRVLKSSPLWIPGKKDGHPVRVYFTIPCNFQYDDTDIYSQGKYVKDGRTYEANPQFFDKFDSFIKSTNRALWPYFADVRNALLNGETVTYDSFNGTLSSNVDFHLLNKRQKRKMRKNNILIIDSSSRVHMAKTMIQKLADFNP